MWVVVESAFWFSSTHYSELSSFTTHRRRVCRSNAVLQTAAIAHMIFVYTHRIYFLTSWIFHTSSHFTPRSAFAVHFSKNTREWNIYFIMHICNSLSPFPLFTFCAASSVLSDGMSINLHRISISHACYFTPFRMNTRKLLHID